MITSTGRLVNDHRRKTIDNLGLPSLVTGLDSLAIFSIVHPDWILIKTVFTQKMLDRSLLASSGSNASTQHDKSPLHKYFQAFDELLVDIAKAIEEENLPGQPRGPIEQVRLGRLT